MGPNAVTPNPLPHPPKSRPKNLQIPKQSGPALFTLSLSLPLSPFLSLSLARAHRAYTRTHTRSHTPFVSHLSLDLVTSRSRSQVHTHTHTHIHTHTRARARARTHTHTCTHTRAHTHTCARARARTHKCTRAHKHMHAHAALAHPLALSLSLSHTHTHTNTRTHTRSHTLSLAHPCSTHTLPITHALFCKQITLSDRLGITVPVRWAFNTNNLSTFSFEVRQRENGRARILEELKGSEGEELIREGREAEVDKAKTALEQFNRVKPKSMSRDLETVWPNRHTLW